MISVYDKPEWAMIFFELMFILSTPPSMQMFPVKRAFRKFFCLVTLFGLCSTVFYGAAVMDWEYRYSYFCKSTCERGGFVTGRSLNWGCGCQNGEWLTQIEGWEFKEWFSGFLHQHKNFDDSFYFRVTCLILFLLMVFCLGAYLTKRSNKSDRFFYLYS